MKIKRSCNNCTQGTRGCFSSRGGCSEWKVNSEDFILLVITAFLAGWVCFEAYMKFFT